MEAEEVARRIEGLWREAEPQWSGIEAQRCRERLNRLTQMLRGLKGYEDALARIVERHESSGSRR